MAIAAAPYQHARLSSVDANVNMSRRSVPRITSDMSLEKASALYQAMLNEPAMAMLAAPNQSDEQEHETIDVAPERNIGLEAAS
jgi:hypothetical protein